MTITKLLEAIKLALIKPVILAILQFPIVQQNNYQIVLLQMNIIQVMLIIKRVWMVREEKIIQHLGMERMTMGK